MTDTLVSSATKEVRIGFDRPFVIIGERINPTGRKILAEEMKNGDYSRVVSDALAQVEAGAHMLDVNAGIPLADEPAILAEAIKLVQSVTDVPISIDSSIVEALEAGLAVYEGKPLVNSVTGDYSRGAAGFWIEGGELVYPVDEITIAANLKDMYRNVACVGDDPDVRGNLRAPSVLISEMTVAGA